MERIHKEVEVDFQKKKDEKKESKEEEEKKKEEEVIDTSTEPKKEETTNLTAEDKQKIEDESDLKYDLELQKIYEKIVEKAEFLTKL